MKQGLDLNTLQKRMSEFLMHKSDSGIEHAGMRVYRNNVTSSLIKALAAQYPAVENLVGDQFFRAIAKDYLLTDFPTSPALTLFGGKFPEFILNHDECRNLPWLADVAELEFIRQLILHAADDPPLNLEEVGAIPDDLLGETILLFRGGVKLLDSDWPVEPIRVEAMAVNPTQVMIDRDTRHYYLVSRKDFTVITVELPEIKWFFLEKLSKGFTLGDSWEALQENFALSDDALTPLLGQVLSDAIFTDFKVTKEIS